MHPNTGSIFLPSSVWAGNVTWRGWSVQWCTCSKWVPFKVPITLLQVQCSRQLSRPELSSLLCPCFSLVPHLQRLCLTLWASPACMPPLFNLVYLAPLYNAALPAYPRLQTSCPPSIRFVSPVYASCPSPHVFGCLPISSTSSFPPDSLMVL